MQPVSRKCRDHATVMIAGHGRHPIVTQDMER